MGMYRMQVYDGQTTGMHWQRQKVAAEHVRQRLRAAAAAELKRMGDGVAAHVFAMAATAGGTQNLGGASSVAFGNIEGRALEVAVVIGTDPETTFSAIVPAPPEVEEFVIAGFLRQKPVELVQVRDGRSGGSGTC